MQVDGKRQLIGLGYLCQFDESAIMPNWFKENPVWHTHGPEICQLKKSFIDASYFKAAMPNELNEDTWEDVCKFLRGKPIMKKVGMMHTWNFIDKENNPEGYFVHNNKAIAFLRVGLSVPDENFLNSTDGENTMDTLALEHKVNKGRAYGGMMVADIGFWKKRKALKKYRKGSKQAKKNIEEMKVAEKYGDQETYNMLAKQGADLLKNADNYTRSFLNKKQLEIFDQYLAQLTPHDHHNPVQESDRHKHH